MPTRPDAARNARGMWTRDPETAARDGEWARLAASGMNYAAIGAEWNVDRSTVLRGVRRALAAAAAETGGRELLAMVTEALVDTMTSATEIAQADHPTVSNGRVFDTIADAGPVLAAHDLRRRAAADLRKLYGLDEPVRAAVAITDIIDRMSLDDLTALVVGEEAKLDEDNHDDSPPGPATP